MGVQAWAATRRTGRRSEQLSAAFRAQVKEAWFSAAMRNERIVLYVEASRWGLCPDSAVASPQADSGGDGDGGPVGLQIIAPPTIISTCKIPLKNNGNVHEET